MTTFGKQYSKNSVLEPSSLKCLQRLPNGTDRSKTPDKSRWFTTHSHTAHHRGPKRRSRGKRWSREQSRRTKAVNKKTKVNKQRTVKRRLIRKRKPRSNTKHRECDVLSDSNVQSSPSSESTPLNLQEDQDHNTKYEPDSELPRLYRAGWLTVRQTYEPSQNSESTYMGLITNSYRNFMDQRSKDSKRIKPKDRFYTRKAICLQPIIQNHHHHHTNKESNNQDSERFEQPDRESNHHQPGRPAAWFLFTKNNLEKEDWYHILLASSKLNGPDSKATFQKDASLFDSEDMAKLLEGIDQQTRSDPNAMDERNARQTLPIQLSNSRLGELDYRSDHEKTRQSSNTYLSLGYQSS
ncbi:hypothetical protein PGT21_033168 [Puccinia graminis f. sp. tritici]|uniref:PH domain-containing protein n=1 Tax=Puccinia graminis f. sp. tritici TaxID=56615 RepID=A0A5B0QCM2_PUCGR|nr:hypothetical protein PGT21_033168 [Puccinia graminis f. sp. tritici]